MMSTIVLEFTPGVDNKVRVSVQAGGAAGAPFDLEPPSLATDLIDALQSGKLTDQQRMSIEQSVTTWLLGAAAGNGLRQRLLDLLNPPVVPGAPPPADAELTFVYDTDLSRRILPLPLEMTRLQADTLALFGRVRSVAHLLRSLDNATQRTTADWPLRVLLFRSSPKGLDAVPKLTPIVDDLKAKIPEAADRLVIHDISSEVAGTAPATFDQFGEALRVVRPHVALFLGHGVISGEKSYLAFEGDQSEYVPVEAADFRIMLQNGPADLGVPLLVLVGCLTAGVGQALPDAALGQAGGATPPSRPLAFLGFAQEVIQSSLGVTASIGMRARIEGDEAKRFIVELFKALTSGPSPGDIGAAVKQARVRLAQAKPGAFSPWVPMVMQAKDQPPPLAFLARPYEKPTLTVDQALLGRRRQTWAGLFDAAMAKVAMPKLEEIRTEFETDVVASANNHPILQPAFAQHAGPDVTLLVQLSKNLDVKELDVVLSLPAGTTLRDVRRSAAVVAAGFNMFRGDNKPNAIELKLETENVATVLAGTVFELDLTFAPATSAVREFAITVTKTKPARAVLGELNVLIQTA
jgi:hypothetical protein